MRLDKFLSNAGCGTRSEVKQYLKKGLIRVNGVVQKKADLQIREDEDQIFYQDQKITLEKIRWFMLNKPAGYVSAVRDSYQKVVLDLIEEPAKEELFPVGRLDIDTEGLLLLTNDGALAHELLSPKKHVDKCYFARIEGLVTQQDVEDFRQGLDIGEKRQTLPAELEILSQGPESQIRVTIREGKFHQIKRMFEAVGKKVIYLKRLSMGTVSLDESLEPGQYRRLTQEEIISLQASARENAGSGKEMD